MSFVAPVSWKRGKSQRALAHRRTRTSVAIRMASMAEGATAENAGAPRTARQVKLVHWTDVHFFVPDKQTKVGIPARKELFGYANLYLMGRREEYDTERLVTRLVQDVAEVNPDAVIFSGDLSALGKEVEFNTAANVLQPMLERFPTVMIAGNHDRYTKRGRLRMDDKFEAWMRGGVQDGVNWVQQKQSIEHWPSIFELECGLRIVALDQGRPSNFSFGAHAEGQISRLRSMLKANDSRRCLVVGHYPVFDPWDPKYESAESNGTKVLPLYDRFGRGLKDVEDLHAALLAHTPLAYLCGHHHAHKVVSAPSKGNRPSFLQICCGNSAYVGHKESYKAGFFEINLEDDGETARIVDIYRHEWDEKNEKYVKAREPVSIKS